MIPESELTIIDFDWILSDTVHLRSHDLRRCFNIELKESIEKFFKNKISVIGIYRLARIKF